MSPKTARPDFLKTLGIASFAAIAGPGCMGGGRKGVAQIDYDKSIPIPDASIHRGFDYFFGNPNCPTTDVPAFPAPRYKGSTEAGTQGDFIFEVDAIMGEVMKAYKLPELAPDARGQLYSLQTEPGETTRLCYEHPDIVKELKLVLQTSKRSGRSAPLARTSSSPGIRRAR